MWTPLLEGPEDKPHETQSVGVGGGGPDSNSMSVVAQGFSSTCMVMAERANASGGSRRDDMLVDTRAK